ncbi:MAG: PP2C family protein-serine/threonine phosphatase [Faecalibacterium sp.]
MALQLIHFTDKGETRSSNQDSYCARIANLGEKTVSFLAVCDGMGGLQAGEVASSAVIKELENWFDKTLPNLARIGLTEEQIFFSWHQRLEQIHDNLLAYAKQTSIRLGTTLSMLLLTDQMLYIAQVGDSRIYLDDRDQTIQLTKDQTLAMQEYEAGHLTPEMLESDIRKGVLLQCIGTGKMEPVFTCAERPSQGAVFVCSDGFYHLVSPEMLHQTLNQTENQAQLRTAFQQLVSFCRANGEKDNITGLALKWDSSDDLQIESTSWPEFWARVSGYGTFVEKHA